VTASDPAGPWSNPYWLPELSGIDPSLFFDEDGSSYIVYNSEAPENKPLYNGHRSIKLVHFDKESMRVSSEPLIIVHGGTDLSKKPVWIEGPHIYKLNGYYYLLAAEGGTEWEHSVVIFRSRNIKGPYVSYENNPILTQRHLDKSRANPVECTGHADLFETSEGAWWAVFLGTRPYEAKHFNTGRESFIAPVRWEDGWPVINPDYDEVQYVYPAPITNTISETSMPNTGQFTHRDEFDELQMSWIFLRNPKQEWHHIKNGTLIIDLRDRESWFHWQKATTSFWVFFSGNDI
jgi:alpha-N-arabinofuranosidase